jgi:hypothetical protein
MNSGECTCDENNFFTPNADENGCLCKENYHLTEDWAVTGFS